MSAGKMTQELTFRLISLKIKSYLLNTDLMGTLERMEGEIHGERQKLVSRNRNSHEILTLHYADTVCP